MRDPVVPTDDEALARAIRQAFAGYRAPARTMPAPADSAPPWRRRPRLLAASLAGVPIVVVIAVALTAQSLVQPPSAFAGWTAVPASPDPALATMARQECVSAEVAVVATLPLVAQDQRGEVALAFFTNGDTFASCLVSRRGLSGSTVIGVGRIEGERAGVLRLLSSVSQEGAQPIEMVVGDVAPEVASVVITRDDGSTVTATVRAGYFLAWWPTAAQPLTYAARGADGRVLEVIEHPL